MPNKMNGKPPGGRRIEHCSFCGKSEEEVFHLIKSPSGLFICDGCVAICSGMFNDEKDSYIRNKSDRITLSTLPKPRMIKEKLDEYVIGQEKAKKVLSVAVYNHYKRILQKVEDDVEIQKSNILFLGPTGVGKTYLAQNLAKTLKVPFAIADATTLTEAGYVGEDVENILLRLIQAADYDVELAEKGIIYIDEIDKISRRSENRSITRDVSGEGVQQALLKIIEGTESNVPPQGGRKHPNQDFIKINTRNILFICGGAFDGIKEIVDKRMGSSVIGFNLNSYAKKEGGDSKKASSVTPHDVMKYGLIPELVGRLPLIVSLDELDRDAFVRILSEPKNSLSRQYKKLFEIDGIQLEFHQEALEKIADAAISSETGARGLRSIIENVMQDIMYETPSDETIVKIIITADTVETGIPEIIRDANKKILPEKIQEKNGFSIGNDAI